MNTTYPEAVSLAHGSSRIVKTWSFAPTNVLDELNFTSTEDASKVLMLNDDAETFSILRLEYRLASIPSTAVTECGFTKFEIVPCSAKFV